MGIATMAALTSRLLQVMTEEQAEQLVERIETVYARAVERGCDQAVEIHFNNKGMLRYLNASDNIRATDPCK